MIFFVRALLTVVSVCCLVAPSADAQSLGEAGRKEAERRARNRDAGVRVPAFGEDDVRSPPDEASSPATIPDQLSTQDKPASTSATASSLEREQAQRQQKEEFWRATMAPQARARVATTQALCNTNPLVLGGG